jgi:hypothetical protein
LGILYMSACMDNQWDPLKDIPDLHGYVVVVTGGR